MLETTSWPHDVPRFSPQLCSPSSTGKPKHFKILQGCLVQATRPFDRREDPLEPAQSFRRVHLAGQWQPRRLRSLHRHHGLWLSQLGALDDLSTHRRQNSHCLKLTLPCYLGARMEGNGQIWAANFELLYRRLGASEPSEKRPMQTGLLSSLQGTSETAFAEPISSVGIPWTAILEYVGLHWRFLHGW